MICGAEPHVLALGTVHAEDPSTATLLGMRTRAYRFQPVQQIKEETDFKYRYSWSYASYSIGLLSHAV